MWRFVIQPLKRFEIKEVGAVLEQQPSTSGASVGIFSRLQEPSLIADAVTAISSLPVRSSANTLESELRDSSRDISAASSRRESRAGEHIGEASAARGALLTWFSKLNSDKQEVKRSLEEKVRGAAHVTIIKEGTLYVRSVPLAPQKVYTPVQLPFAEPAPWTGHNDTLCTSPYFTGAAQRVQRSNLLRQQSLLRWSIRNILRSLANGGLSA